MKILLHLLLILSAAFLYYGCACKSAVKESDIQTDATVVTIMQTEIPNHIIEKANAVIIKQTGSMFFNKFIKINNDKCRVIPEAYYLSYQFQMPGKDYINEEISLILDKNGNIQSGFEVTGIPQCASGKTDCTFDINKEDALRIAKDAGMKEGIKDWEADFKWDSEQNDYVWIVRSTLTESMGSNGKRGTGERMLIDPNSGEVLAKTEWKVL